MRNIKILGLAFIALLAFSAIGAATASADDLTAEAYPTTLTGVKDGTFQDSFTTTAGIVTCDTPKYSASISGATTDVTVTPDYTTAGHSGTHLSACRTSGIPSVIDMNGCTYTFKIGAATTGDADLACPAGKEITVTVAAATSATLKCTVHIPAQTEAQMGGGITYKNINAGTTRGITVEAALTEITYKHVAGSGLGACTSGHSDNGTLTAQAIVTGDVPSTATHRGIFLS